MGKNLSTNTKVVFGCGGCLVLVILVIVLANVVGSKIKTTTPSSNQSSTTTEKKAELTYKEVTSYKKGGKTWRFIVFSKRPSNDELINIAKELHFKNKTDYYNFFDDDEKIEEFKNWDINYAKTTNVNAFPYPEEWAKAHDLAIMNEMYVNGSAKWQITESFGGKLSDIE